jgi:general secretion pathway protein C
VPQQEKGVVVGLKLYGVRRASYLGALGLRNGDLVKRVGGYDVSDPEKALEAYAKLRNATEIRIELERRGVPTTLTYRVVP